MHPQPPRSSVAQSLPSANLPFQTDWTGDEQVGLVVNADFVSQDFQRQEQVREWGCLRHQAEVAEGLGGQYGTDLKPDGNGTLAARADRRIMPQGTRLAHTQNDVISFPGGKLPGQGLVDERRFTGVPPRGDALATLEKHR